jgi:hypothetical protein
MTSYKTADNKTLTTLGELQKETAERIGVGQKMRRQDYVKAIEDDDRQIAKRRKVDDKIDDMATCKICATFSILSPIMACEFYLSSLFVANHNVLLFTIFHQTRSSFLQATVDTQSARLAPIR